MMKKVLFVVASVVAMGIGAAAQNVLGMQEQITSLMNDPLNGQSKLEAPVGALSGLVTRGGVFDPPEEMRAIMSRIDKANHKGMSKSQMINFIDELTHYIVEHPKQRIHGYMQLGNLYRNVMPEKLRNSERAVEMYERVLELLPTNVNSNDRGQLYYIMAHCYDFDGSNGDLTRIAGYLARAYKNCPRYACSMGDLYLCGWGCYQDLYIAAMLYDLAQRHGDETAYNNLNTLEYIIRKTQPNNSNDSASIEHFRMFLYYLRLANNIGYAESELQAAAQLDFAPAYYVLGTMYERMLPGIEPNIRRREMFYWFRRGADVDFAPCLTALARVTAQYTLDSAKGDIYKLNAQGHYSPVDQARCAKQSLELYQRAAELGSAIAMRSLGDLYAQGTTTGYPNQDLGQAYYWYSLAEHAGNAAAIAPLDALEKFYHPTATDTKAVHRFMQSHTESMGENIVGLLDLIDLCPRFRQPNHVEANTYEHTTSISIIEEEASYNSHLANTYKTVYEMFADEVSKMAMNETVDPATLKTLQAYMRKVRIHSQKHPLHTVKQSMWESWEE